MSQAISTKIARTIGLLAGAVIGGLKDIWWGSWKVEAARWRELAGDILARAEAAETALAAMAERNKALMGALADLDKVASEVARLGAVPGSQWSRLTVASLRAHAALRANATDASEGER